MTKITLIGAPVHVGCDKHGPQLAPQVLRRRGIVKILEHRGHQVVDAGDIKEPTMDASKKFSVHDRVKYFDEVQNVSRQLSEKMFNALSADTFPIVIGGDHLMGLGNTAGMARYFGENAGLIWFDAHGDFNTEASSPSGNAHGMPCAALMGICEGGLNELVEVKIKPENIFWVGIRSLDLSELRFGRDNNLSIYDMETVREKGMPYIINDILAKIKERGIEHIHCSIDVDGIDPSETPGTGTPVPDGVKTDEFRLLLNALFATRKISSVGLAEFNPELDHDQKTERWCLNTIDYIASLLQTNKADFHPVNKLDYRTV